MHIWIDGQCLQTSSRLRGIGRYVHELIRGLVRNHPEVDISISFNAALADEAIVARDALAAWIKPTSILIWQGIAEVGEALHGYTARRQLSELALAHHVACLQPDVALSASPFEGARDRAVPLLPVSSQNFSVGCIFYDAIPYRFPSKYLNYDGLSRCYDRRLSLHCKFDFMLAISEFSRREAGDLIPDVPVMAIHAGIGEDFLRLAQGGAAGRASTEDYLFYVGGLDWRKNVARVVEAFALLPGHLKQDLQFYLAGDAPAQMRADISELWKKCALPERNLKILGHISDAALIDLYVGARAVIQPSLMEGFGLTALEAMSCGTPVIAASAGALPEMIGIPEALFDPEDPQDISRRIVEVCTDRALADSFAEHGLVQTKKYSWKRSADLTVAALQQFHKGVKYGSLDELRALCLDNVREISVDSVVSSRALAIAEPVKSVGRRLLVDVTATTKLDHETGIQRVVKKMAAALTTARDARVPGGTSLVYCDTADGFFEAGRSSDGKLSFGGRTFATKVLPNAGDVVLMLDSSWEFHESHRSVFRAARLRGAEVITTLYDLVPIKVSAFCHPGIPPIFSDWLKVALAFSTGVVCISKAVADEFVQLLHAVQFPRPMKIGYWHLGADFTFSPAGVVHRKFEAPSPRFLMVGTIEPRKGYVVALDAFDALWAQGFAGSLILVGKRGWNMDHFISRVRCHPENGRKLHWIERASDEELQRHYASCDALIAASYVEGFGLPIVEAAEYNKPVIASDIPVFREVVGENQSAVFFDVGSTEALAACIDAFSRQLDQTLAFRNKGTRWITWTESARQLADVVTGGNWYHNYQPVQGRSAEAVLGIGEVVMRRPLSELERVCRLELVQRPSPASDGKTLRIVVKLSNLSNVSWASASADGTKLAVQLGHHILRDDGSTLQYENPVTSIPFVVGPGDYLYMAVDVSSGWLDRGGKFVEIEMLQEGAGWWGKPLRVSLSTAE
ncbi:glycosyl transferase, group 1 [Nitrobacter hamburgensis X14]|uniref:Glycosyl transferase, group 1 n=1 Tax=Nitrobacter hamburgensis (strain DSM 10229 / NCIMB 13809 / X14) TaxID=323097 RepID=Q1QJP7_NITHX|nr:glycosyltransferase family 1 protein [Nitrobacter hamburgensis]ABE63550.1 glycosyl transferase, group 1 [Nitrobacter hamburgensis X14]